MGFDKNSKIIKILIFIAILLIIFAGYLLVTNNARFKIKMAIQTVFNKVDDSLKGAENTKWTNAFLENKVENTNRVVTKLSLSDDILEYIGPAGKKLENFINNSTIETNIKSDIPNKFMDIGLDYTYNAEKIHVNTYIDSNSMYLYMKDYFGKYLELKTEDFETDEIFKQMTSNVKIEDIRYIIGIVKFSMVDASEFATVTNAKAEIDVDGKKINVNETKLNIDTNFLNKLQTIFLNKVLYDNKAKVILFNMFPTGTYQTITDLEADIQNELSKIVTTVEENELFGEYSIYTSGVFNKLIRSQIKVIGEDEVVVQYTTYNAEKFDTQISVYENNELSGQVNVIENANDNFDITITVGQDISMDLKGVITESLLDIAYTLRISSFDDFKGDIRIENKNISETEMNQTFAFRLNTPESYGTINLTADSTTKIIDTPLIPPVILSINSVAIDELTDSQSLELMTNFQNKNPKTITAVGEIVNDILENFMTYNMLDSF